MSFVPDFLDLREDERLVFAGQAFLEQQDNAGEDVEHGVLVDPRVRCVGAEIVLDSRPDEIDRVFEDVEAQLWPLP